ncbi:peptidoglycan-binding domain-containing protein [Leptothoe sp. PORK10 BA2]|uniref:peptidoglycan-binding domain-containing protein n=1 Tax=Leptothoe sp. PORK10 BA2 TaxID=3110254 RepID=UPI002B203516|nr:peptidoglycan-binding domain-containing protein [Leptothoe sp. PORK10 BA2]MEA5462262.1 peptidoglycan-binding domain-containing protein [Leptothoe sp. PORK10 BA2]
MFSSPSYLNISDYAQQHRELIQAYCQLSVQPNLSDRDTARLDAILATAETDPLISFLIDEADHMLAHLYNFIDDADITEQQEKLQTCLSDEWLNQAFQDLAYRLQSSQCKSLQQYLKTQGFYQGAIDGVLGQVTKVAMQKCCDQQGELPQPFPINTPDAVSC